MPQTITKHQHLQVVGLLAVAAAQYQALESSRLALADLLGEDPDEFGHTGDAVYNNYSAAALLKNMNITVSK